MPSFKRAAIVAASFIPTGCHITLTAPWLIRHGSSAAFDAAVLMGFLCLAVIFVAAVAVIPEEVGK